MEEQDPIDVHLIVSDRIDELQEMIETKACRDPWFVERTLALNVEILKKIS